MLTESLNIYVIDKDGNKVTFPNVQGMQPAIVDVNLNRERMAGAPTNTSTLMYPVCLDSYWTKKEFIEIGSERYYVKQVPTSEKNTEDTRYKHEITFVSERDILENVFFFDCVTQDTSSQISDKPRSNTTEFSFYGDLNELVQRLNDSLSYSKIYDPKGENGFCIVIDDDVEIGEAKEVSMTDAYFATAMQEIYNVFEVPYYWVGKICHVGYQENEITEPFEYGSGNGLISVQKTNAEFRLINRITGQGSADNIPYYYPNTDVNGIAEFDCYNITNAINVKVLTSVLTSRIGSDFLRKDIILSENPSSKDFSVSADEAGGYNSGISITSGGAPIYSASYIVNIICYLPKGVIVDLSTLSGSAYSTKEEYAKILDSGSEVKKYCHYYESYEQTSNYAYEEVPINKEIDMEGYWQFQLWIPWRIQSVLKTTEDWIYAPYYLGIKREGAFIVKYKNDELYSLSIGDKIIPYSNSGIVIPNIEQQPCDRSDITFKPDSKGVYRLGIEVVDKTDNPSKIVINNVKRVPIISKLMPSVYRQTEGAERFYNAKNETYTDENGNYYSFNNPYVPSEPLEGKQDFEDIKPTINGITNENGELFGEIAAVAFDDTDSDDLSVKDASDPNTNTATPVHPYFYVKLHRFSGVNGFNLFKQGLAQGAMTFNFITGSCAGCSFKVQVSEGKQVDNHYEFKNLVQVDEQGNIVAGDSGDKIKASNPIDSQQDTMTNSVWIALEKDNSTFGVLMPNATNNYRPKAGDKFVITNILLPTQYITAAEKRLDAALVKYMSENNDEKFTFSIKFSRIYLQEHPEIAEKINENTKLHVKYNNVDYPLFVSSYSRKSDDNILDEISVELSEKLTIAQNKSKEQMDSIMGNVNEQINSAIQDNNNNTTQGVSANDINSLKSLLGNKLSRVSDDTAAGFITFLRGLAAKEEITAEDGIRFGQYINGFLGSGAYIDNRGRAEFESIFSRSFISTPELRYNRIAVTEGEQWCTNGYGIIESVDTEAKTITLHLEENDYASVAVGDLCRGVYNNFGTSEEYQNTTTLDADNCGFPIKAGFFTSYFRVSQILEQSQGKCVFAYELRNDSTPHPCAQMKFAQYGNDIDEARQASAYMSSTGHFYFQSLEKVSTWEISSVNVTIRFGWVDGFPVKLTGGSYQTLKGYGLYAPDNIYFGNAIVQLDPKTVDSLRKDLQQYTIELSSYTDVITVDDAGNVIGGLYKLNDETKHSFRIAPAVFVRKGNDYLIEADAKDDAGEGTFKMYVTPKNCTVEVINGAVCVTAIDNIKDGVSGTADDVDFDYDAMRKMESISVVISVMCEGVGSITKEFKVAIKHDSKPYISMVMDNQNASVSWNTKAQKYIGLPYSFSITAARANDLTPISEVSVVAPEGVTVTSGIQYGVVVLDVTSLPQALGNVTDIHVTVTARYAGIDYEQTLVHTLNRYEDVNVYELKPSVTQVVASVNTSGEKVADVEKVTCSVLCSSSDDKQYILTTEQMTTVKAVIKYSIDDGATLSDCPADGLSVSPEWSKIVFHLLIDGSEVDSQDVPVMLNGVDGNGIEYVFLLTTEDKKPTIYDDSTTEAFQSPDYCPYTDAAHTRQWTDEPTGVGINNRYEWVAQRKKQYGKWLAFSEAKKWTVYAIDGTSPYSLDLTNESSQVLCDQDGNVIGGYETTTIQLFHGASVMSISDFTITITATNISYSLSGAVITPSAFESGKDSAQIAVKAVLKTNTSIVLTAVYSITKNKAGKDGVIYSLQPSVSTFSKDSNGGWVTKSFYLYVKKTAGTGATEITTLAALNAEGLTLKYGTTTVTSSTLELVPSTICGSNAYADLYLYKGSVVIDRERINVVSDGEPGQQGDPGPKGDDAVTYSIESSTYNLVVDGEGTLLTTGNVTISAYKQVGSSAKQPIKSVLTFKGVKGSEETLISGNIAGVESFSIDASKLIAYDSIKCYSIVDDTTSVCTITITRYGEKGDKGESAYDITMSNLNLTYNSRKGNIDGNYPVSRLEVNIQCSKGGTPLKYTNGTADDWVCSTLTENVSDPIIDGVLWSFKVSEDGYTFTYVIYCKTTNKVDVEIPFVVTAGGVQRQYKIHLQSHEDGGTPLNRGIWSSEGYIDENGEATNGYFYRYKGDTLIRDRVAYKIGGIYYYYMVKNFTGDTPVTEAPATAVTTEVPVEIVDEETGETITSTAEEVTYQTSDKWEQMSKVKTIFSEVIYADDATIGGFHANATNLWSGGDTPDKASVSLDGETGEINSRGAEASVRIANGLIEVLNNVGNCNIRFGLKNGYAVLSYYDNNGNLLYDLGPNGIDASDIKASKLEKVTIYCPNDGHGFYSTQYLTSAGKWATEESEGSIAYLVVEKAYNTIWSGGFGSKPTVGTPLTCYRYTAAKINGVYQAEESYGLTQEQAKLCDGLYFTKNVINEGDSLVNYKATGIIGIEYGSSVAGVPMLMGQKYAPKYKILSVSITDGKAMTSTVVSLETNGLIENT